MTKKQGQLTATQQQTKGQTTNMIFESPRRRYRHSRKRVTPDRFDKDAVRRKIYDLYEQKQHVTVTKLLRHYRITDFLMLERLHYDNFYMT